MIELFLFNRVGIAPRVSDVVQDVRNLIITNTSPLRYGDVLANWKPLPLYEGDPINEPPDVTLIVGVGYHRLNIREILEVDQSR